MTHPTDALRLVPTKATPHMIAAMDRNIFGQKMGLGSDFLHGLWENALSAAPASPLPEGGGWPVHIVRSCGATIDEQRRAVLKSESYKHGDMILAWMSEGDLYGNPFVELEQIPAAPTGDAK